MYETNMRCFRFFRMIKGIFELNLNYLITIFFDNNTFHKIKFGNVTILKKRNKNSLCFVNIDFDLKNQIS